jgi:methylated-DNA-[protein]-cysteine S-methyltransferase
VKGTTATRESAGDTTFGIDSPIGPLTGAVDERGRLVRLDFDVLPGTVVETTPNPAGANAGDITALSIDLAPPPAAARVIAELADYFAGRRKKFTFPMAPRGTDFQRRVWSELRRIPYGRTMSYSELAARIGHPDAIRAVGRANGANPLAIVVPCHRVIGADGTLTGYGGGLDRKRFLLELEGALLPVAAPAQRSLYG